MTIFRRRQPSLAGLALPVTPDLTLDVEDLSLSDGESVTSWGDISTWELGDPTYNASENAVQFASGQGGGQLRSLFGFDDIPALSLTHVSRVTLGTGNVIQVSGNSSDVTTRALATQNSSSQGVMGGRISDSDSYAQLTGPTISSGVSRYTVYTHVWDFANDDIRMYVNGFPTANTPTGFSGGAGNTDASVAKTAQIFGINRSDSSNLLFVGFAKLAHLYVGTALTKAQVEQEAAFILSEYDL